jgi:hypothetical protein
MTLVCPCCKAPNDATTCRRCKADLSLMGRLETHRDHLLNEVRTHVLNGDLHQAGQRVDRAIALRSDDSSLRLKTVLALLGRDFDEGRCTLEGLAHG